MSRHSINRDLTIASSVYDRLRHDILQGALNPGLKLRINVLCEQYATGNSPMREALNRLSAEGLVDRKEQRGFYVVQTSSADLAELVRTRCWMEEIALRESMANADNAWHESLVLTLYRLSVVPRAVKNADYSGNPDWERLHNELHRALISRCGSTRLIRYCDEMRDHAYRYRQLSLQTVHENRDTHGEHSAIVQAILDGEQDRAVELLIRHYHLTAKINPVS